MSKDNHLHYALTPQESNTLRILIANFRAAIASAQQLEASVGVYVQNLRDARGLDKDWMIDLNNPAELKKQEPEPQVQIAQPGHVASVAKDAEAAKKLHVVGA